MQPLTKGQRYEDRGNFGTALAIRFTAPVDGLLGDSLAGLFGLIQGDEPLDGFVTMTHLDEALAIKDPKVDFAHVVVTPEARELVMPTPNPYLEWLAQQPGFVASPIEETELAGHPARAMHYEITPVEGTFPCGDDPRVCLGWLYLRAGAISTNVAGDAGTVYELTVAGQRLAVDVSDNPTAQEVAETLEFVVAEPPAGFPDAEPLPYLGAVDSDTSYVWHGLNSYDWVITSGTEGLVVQPQFLRFYPGFVLGDASGECMSVNPVGGFQREDGTDWYGIVEGEPADTGGPVPDDPVAKLKAFAAVDVVATGAMTLGEVEAITVDISSTTNVVITGKGLRVLPGTVYRLVILPEADGFHDVATVKLGTASRGSHPSGGARARLLVMRTRPRRSPSLRRARPRVVRSSMHGSETVSRTSSRLRSLLILAWSLSCSKRTTILCGAQEMAHVRATNYRDIAVIAEMAGALLWVTSTSTASASPTEPAADRT